MKFSVLTCSYNTLAGVKEAVKQVQSQREAGFEVEHLIIDGGSTDGTAEWLKKEGGHGLTPFLRWISEPDRGLYDALNKGMAMATGEVIGWLHTDDLWEKGLLSKVAEVFSDSGPAVDGVYGDLVYVESDRPDSIRRRWNAGPFDPGKFYNGWMPPHTALFIRIELFERSGPYRLDFSSAADYEWMLRACLKHQARLRYVPQRFLRMRAGGASNVSFRHRLHAHSHDRNAWRVNGLKPKPWTLIMKVLRKLPQWIVT